MSGNPRSIALPASPPALLSVPLQGPPLVPPLAPPSGSQQNSQVYIKEISINKSPIFIRTTNRARKWLADVQAYLMLN